MKSRDECDYRVTMSFKKNILIIPRVFVELEGWEDITDIWDSGIDILKMTFPELLVTQELYDDAWHIDFEEGSRPYYYIGGVFGGDMGWRAI